MRRKKKKTAVMMHLSGKWRTRLKLWFRIKRRKRKKLLKAALIKDVIVRLAALFFD